MTRRWPGENRGRPAPSVPEMKAKETGRSLPLKAVFESYRNALQVFTATTSAATPVHHKMLLVVIAVRIFITFLL